MSGDLGGHGMITIVIICLQKSFSCPRCVDGAAIMLKFYVVPVGLVIQERKEAGGHYLVLAASIVP